MGLHLAGMLLEYSTDGGSSYTEITGVESLTPVTGATRATGDDTDMKATNLIRTKIASWTDPGQLTFSVKYTHTLLTALIGLRNRASNLAKVKWRVTWPLEVATNTTEATWVSDGILTEVNHSEGSVDSDDPAMIECTVELSGSPTFTGESA